MSAHTPMVVAAARVLCKRGAEQCNVDADDSWNVYGDDYLADAQAALDACGALELLEALRFYAASCNATESTPCGYEGNLCCKVASAAIAKAVQP